MGITGRFTPEQELAINNAKGNLQIIACAGSGKTETVSQRIATLIKNGENPAKIVAFTFSEKAADELKARIRRILDEECPSKADFGEMYIGTIHSFCLFMLKELVPKYRAYDVLDEASRVAFVSIPSRYYTELKLVDLEKHNNLRKFETIQRFLISADIVRMEEIDRSKITDEDFRESLDAYEETLEREHYFDFDGLLSRLVTLLEADQKLKKALHEKVRNLVVDEYQDINRIQERLIAIIAGDCDSVCVVGDDDQCIYHWRGSEVDNIRRFSERYPKVKQVSLEQNFRSTAAIIHSASSFIAKNSNRIKKTMRSPEHPVNGYAEGDLTVRHFDTEEEELESIPMRITELHGTDFIDKSGRNVSLAYGDFAVLVRTNEDAAKLIPYFEEQAIKCLVIGGDSVFSSEEVKLGLDCLKYLFPESADVSSNLDAIVEAYRRIFGKNKQADARRFTGHMETLKAEANKVSAKSPKDYLQGGIQSFYLRILQAFGADVFNFGDTCNYNLAGLSLAISDYEKVWKRIRTTEVRYFYGFVYAYASGRYADAKHSDVGLIDAVKILTIHKAKGLEFPVVFMPGLVKKRMPNPPKFFVDTRLFSIGRYLGTEDDERRVWYTAMTRSMKYLFLSSSISRIGKKKQYSRHPFVSDIDPHYFTEPKPLARPRSGHPPRLQTVHFVPTSFSEISAYERCGFEYQLRHIYGFNVGIPPAFGYGAQIHNILNIIHKRYKDKLPTDAEIDELFEENFYMRYALGSMLERTKTAAKRVVKNYVRLHGQEFNMVLQTEKNFELILDDALITGQIDLLKKMDAKGKVTGIEIVDFKTENTSSYNPNHDLQLRLYAIACLESLGISPKKATVHHLDENRRDAIDISPNALDDTKEVLRGNIQGIVNRKFLPKPKKTLCKSCDYRGICSYQK